jgi:hypothetical protein
VASKERRSGSVLLSRAINALIPDSRSVPIERISLAPRRLGVKLSPMSGCAAHRIHGVGRICHEKVKGSTEQQSLFSQSP